MFALSIPLVACKAVGVMQAELGQPQEGLHAKRNSSHLEQQAQRLAHHVLEQKLLALRLELKGLHKVLSGTARDKGGVLSEPSNTITGFIGDGNVDVRGLGFVVGGVSKHRIRALHIDHHRVRQRRRVSRVFSQRSRHYPSGSCTVPAA